MVNLEAFGHLLHLLFVVDSHISYYCPPKSDLAVFTNEAQCRGHKNSKLKKNENITKRGHTQEKKSRDTARNNRLCGYSIQQ